MDRGLEAGPVCLLSLVLVSLPLLGTGQAVSSSLQLTMYTEVANPQDSFVLTKDCGISLLGS